jgi:hypothetical protein
VREDEHIALCVGDKAWLSRSPRMTESEVFGVATAGRKSDAVDAARVEAAKSVSVEIRELVRDTQVLWSDNDEGNTREHVTRAATSSVNTRMTSCQEVEVCRVSSGRIAALISCTRKSELERALHRSAGQIGALQLKDAVVLAVPGSDPDGYISYLGEYAMRTLQDAVAALPGTTFAFARAPAWSPKDLHEVARELKSTHLLRAEYIIVQDLQLRFSIYLQDTTSDQIVRGSATSFEVELSEAQASLLTVRGPLLPQHVGQRLAQALGDYKISLRMNRTDLLEGQTIKVTFELQEGGYAYLYDIYEDGRATLLLPSIMRQSNYFEPGAKVTLPPPEAAKTIALVACPLGEQERTREYLKLVVSPVPLDLSDSEPAAVGTVSEMDGTPLGGMGDFVEKLKGLQSFGTAELPFFIRRGAERAAACQQGAP